MNFTRIKRLIGEAAWAVGGRCCAVLGSLVLVRALTEYLNPMQYGELALGLTFVALVSGTCLTEVGNAVGRLDLDEEKIRTLGERRLPIFGLTLPPSGHLRSNTFRSEETNHLLGCLMTRTAEASA